MTDKKLPFDKKEIENIIEKFPTPFHIYDEKGIRENARRLVKAFSVFPGFKEYFAVKACPNPFIMKILKEEGFGADCSSMAELILSEKTGINGENIMFTSNETPSEEYRKASELGAIINLDDITHISYLEKHLGKLPELICFRFNPGPERAGNAIIGNPKEAKYGFTRSQVIDGINMIKSRGVKRFGIHTMVASNELNKDYFVETLRMLYALAVEIKEKTGVKLEFVNMGGGIGIPYKPEQDRVDIEWVASEGYKLYKEMIEKNGLAPLKLYMECGRMVTGPFGYLVTKVVHKKEIYKNYIGLDACMANLMRPALYGSYHHITVLGKEFADSDKTYDVVGSLCENNDKFAIDRQLPLIESGDIIAIHDAGAHGHAMGFNYNGKLRSAELLLRSDRSVELIRRAETLDDLFATLDFSKL